MESVVLLTGATGFLGKVVLQELFRCRSQFYFDHIYIIVRPKAGNTAEERFRELAKSSPCFSKLPDMWLRDVTVISGDLSEESCGINLQVYKIHHQVTHIIHCAASVSFQASVDKLLVENVTSSLNLILLANKCERLQRIVVTSTAYVAPWTGHSVEEIMSPLPVSPRQLFVMLQSGVLSEQQALHLTGHPNLYTLTKCIMEHIVIENGESLPLTIVRPSIISASWEYPIPGWVDSYTAFTGFVSAVSSGTLRVIKGDPNTAIDVVPVDAVAACLIQQLFDNSHGQYHRVVHATSGRRGSMHLGGICRLIMSAKSSKHPALRPKIRFLGRNKLAFLISDMLHQSLILSIQMIWSKICQNDYQIRQIKRARKVQKSLNSLFEHFTTHTYDFRQAKQILDSNFDKDLYLSRVFHGAAVFLASST